MAKQKYRWLTVEIFPWTDQVIKRVAKKYNVSQAKVLGILVTLWAEKLQEEKLQKKKKRH